MKPFLINHFFSLSRIPRIEFVKIKPVEFFPPTPSVDQLSTLRSICIGTKTRTIGDALMLTRLPRKLKEKYPHLKITTYPRAFNPVVFENNPYIDGVSYFPDKLYGDDNNLGQGQLIQLKEQAFGLEMSLDPHAELYLSEKERQTADHWLTREVSSGNRPICILHPWGHTRKHVMDSTRWEDLVFRLKSKFSFIQVGIEGHEKILGCDAYFFTSRAFHQARKLFALISKAQIFLGVDSGPMHIARAFGLPSLVITENQNANEVFEARKKYPYFQMGNQQYGFLYEANTHLDATVLAQDQMRIEVESFFSR